jgi:hypothetical protein
MHRRLLTTATVSLVSILIFAAAALAGKLERAYIASDIDPAVKESESKFKAGCGCALKITINDNTKKELDDLQQVKYIVDGLQELAASAYCKDAETRKVMCRMKSLEVAKGTEAKFTFKDAKGVVTHDGTTYLGWKGIAQGLDK